MELSCVEMVSKPLSLEELRKRKSLPRWSRLKLWMKENWLFFLVFVFVMVFVMVFGEISRFYSSVAMANPEMLKALVEAEATIIGFFGLIFIYALTSLDSRLDRLEEELFSLTTNKQLEIPKELSQAETSKISLTISSIQTSKKKLVNDALRNGLLLVVSLLLLTLALGTGQTGLGQMACDLGVGFFFLGIATIFWMLRELSKTPVAAIR